MRKLGPLALLLLATIVGLGVLAMCFADAIALIWAVITHSLSAGLIVGTVIIAITGIVTAANIMPVFKGLHRELSS